MKLQRLKDTLCFPITWRDWLVLGLFVGAVALAVFMLAMTWPRPETLTP